MPRPAVDEYPARKAQWTRQQQIRERQDREIASGRLAIFAIGVAVAILAVRGTVTVWWLVLPIAAFIPLLTRHDRIIRARQNASRLVGFYDRAIARLEDRWAGGGDTGERFVDDEHLYAADLDLFGRGSLFELLSLARTHAGEETLAGWLKQPASGDVIAARHAAIGELRPGLELREALTLAGGEIRAGVHSTEVTAWAVADSVLPGRARVVAAIALSIVLPVLVFLWWYLDSLLPLLLAAALRAIYQQVEGTPVEAILQRADAAARDLTVLRPALIRLERESFDSPALRELQSGLRRSRIDASAAIQRLCQYVEMHDWSHNIVFTPVAAMLMWNSHLAFAVERWRATHGREIATWLRVVGEFEALSSLAAYAYEHPDDPFPSIAPADEGASVAVFCGEALGHPLLPATQMVRNDVRLDRDTRLIVVSGSNMSGKSTLLRTVGINAVLALAGAPVRARSLRVISPLAIGATLRIQDSLQQGRSRFFAEITRIRHIADLAAQRPLLFLLDELFHGTNSHDRLVGATGVLKNLLDRGAVGLITTHDLALTAITRDLGSRAINTHFEDSFDGTEMRFDYQMKPGPVTRSNAIALMRAVGLNIEEGTS